MGRSLANIVRQPRTTALLAGLVWREALQLYLPVATRRALLPALCTQYRRHDQGHF